MRLPLYLQGGYLEDDAAHLPQRDQPVVPVRVDTPATQRRPILSAAAPPGGRHLA